MTALIALSAKRAAPQLFSKQRALLELLDALGGALSLRGFQELLFLYCEGLGADDAPYDFVPYEEGVFSFSADADRRKLIARGLLLDEDGWCLSDAGREVIIRERRDELIAFPKTHRELRGAALAAELYRRFPFFATRSEDAERVLEEDEAALARIRALEARMVGPALSTIGYEGRSLES